jgi:23S rRNA U2552 (ribose-2'-O)-methylase RlmE/FtsJ
MQYRHIDWLNSRPASRDRIDKIFVNDDALHDSRARDKLSEIMFSYDIRVGGKSFLDLGGGPGEWSRLLLELGGSGGGITLETKGMSWTPSITQHPDWVDYADGKSGNLISGDYLIDRQEKFDFVFADGASGSNFKEWDLAPLLYAEVDVCMKWLKRGGTAVFKIYDAEYTVTDAVITVLMRSFRSVDVYKPRSSRNVNEERYLVCRDRVATHKLPALTPLPVPVGRAMIVSAISGSGKTFFSKQVSWVDGDDLITWPETTEKWWKDDSIQPIVSKRMRYQVLAAAYERPGQVIMINAPDIADVHVHLPEKEHMARLVMRRNQGSAQPLDRFTQEFDLDQGRRPTVPVFTSFKSLFSVWADLQYTSRLNMIDINRHSGHQQIDGLRRLIETGAGIADGGLTHFIGGVAVILGGGRTPMMKQDVLWHFDRGSYYIGVDGATFGDVSRAVKAGVLTPGLGLHGFFEEGDPELQGKSATRSQPTFIQEWEGWAVLRHSASSLQRVADSYETGFPPWIPYAGNVHAGRVARCYTNSVPVIAVHGYQLGFRVMKFGRLWYSILDSTYPITRITKELESWTPIPVGVELLRGRYIRGDFLTMDWIKRPRFHRQALFSISNTLNPATAWKTFMDGGGDFTFNYPTVYASTAFMNSPRFARVRVEIAGRRVTVFAESDTFQDHLVDPNRITCYAKELGIPISQLSYPDFLAVRLSEGYAPINGMYGPNQPRDGFMNTWTYFTSQRVPGYPWPEQYNTQTWWVKTPSASLRFLFRQGANDQRVYRAIALKRLTPQAQVLRMDDKFFGWLPEYQVGVDLSGHALSMLIMAGYGVVDLARYWDTVLAYTEQAVTKGKKDKGYLQLVRDKRVTEDALVSPFKLWHTYWDFLAALYAYIIMAKDLKYTVNPWVIRITHKGLKAIELIGGDFKPFKRKSFDSQVLAGIRQARQADQGL